MKNVKRCGFWAALLAAGLVLATATMVRAQDDLGGAKTLYVNASYDEALAVLDKQAATAGTERSPRRRRSTTIAPSVSSRSAGWPTPIRRSRPAFRRSVHGAGHERARSARGVGVHRGARAAHPEVARAALAEGRQLMQKGDAAAANRRFEAVTKLLSEPGWRARGPERPHAGRHGVRGADEGADGGGAAAAARAALRHRSRRRRRRRQPRPRTRARRRHARRAATPPTPAASRTRHRRRARSPTRARARRRDVARRAYRRPGFVPAGRSSQACRRGSPGGCSGSSDSRSRAGCRSTPPAR
jgi:hypothetical protein